MHSTSVRIDVDTHEELKRVAEHMGVTVGRAVTLAVRALRQERMGAELGLPVTAHEQAWLDAELG